MKFIANAAEVPDHSDLLFVDFHGTLSEGRLWDTLDSKIFEIIDRCLFRNRPDIIGDWMLGALDSEAVASYVAERTDAPFELIWRHLVESATSLRPHGAFEQLFVELSASLEICILTGNMDTLHRFTLKEPLAGVNYIASSNVLGTTKEEFLSDLMCRRNGAHRRHYLIDDSPSLVNFALDHGISAQLTSSLSHTKELLRSIATLQRQRGLGRRSAA